MSKSPEGYQPSEDEVKQAEEIMTTTESKESDKREKYMEDIDSGKPFLSSGREDYMDYLSIKDHRGFRHFVFPNVNDLDRYAKDYGNRYNEIMSRQRGYPSAVRGHQELKMNQNDFDNLFRTVVDVKKWYKENELQLEDLQQQDEILVEDSETKEGLRQKIAEIKNDLAQKKPEIDKMVYFLHRFGIEL